MEDFPSWSHLILTRISKDLWGKVISIYWGLWSGINKLVWHDKGSKLIVIVNHNLFVLNSWKTSLNHHIAIEINTKGEECRWKKSAKGWTALSIDAGFSYLKFLWSSLQGCSK